MAGNSVLRGSLFADGCTDCVLRGRDSSVVTLALVPTLYSNSINYTYARGFRLQYVATDVGSQLPAPDLRTVRGNVGLKLRLTPVTQQFTIRAHKLQELIALIAQLMALGSGLSFLCRLFLWIYLKTLSQHTDKWGTKTKEFLLYEMLKECTVVCIYYLL